MSAREDRLRDIARARFRGLDFFSVVSYTVVPDMVIMWRSVEGRSLLIVPHWPMQLGPEVDANAMFARWVRIKNEQTDDEVLEQVRWNVADLRALWAQH